ncbi:MAG: DUF2202 domain-containing protein, partial [Planctomycetaceae bacterium]|nr:DUF2202 domain-containing protein [Planctomycetaceae bacterium]
QRANRQGPAALQPASPSGNSRGVINLSNLWEEEKLARDVYTRLAQSTNLPIFRNIAQAESQHMHAVAQLAQASGMNDVPGVFSNPEYQRLYDSLVAAGNTSPLDALRVGARIEEMDIADLQRMIARTNDPRTQQVLTNLLRASGNHLRAFTSQLSVGGAGYTPQILSQADYDQIINAAGNGGNGQGGQGSGARGRFRQTGDLPGAGPGAQSAGHGNGLSPGGPGTGKKRIRP